MRWICVFGLAVAIVACNGTTGDQLVTFRAYARGVPEAGQPFVVGGYTIQLTTAKMRIGALYFNQAPPATGAQSPICIAQGVYAAQVPGPVEVDLLSSKLQEFTVYGNGSADVAESWQIWLTDGDINEANLSHMVDLEGTATAADQTYSFGAIVTINDNRLAPVSDPAQPGENPICKQRIIQIGGIHVGFFQGGTLTITVDPRAWFSENIDFSGLPLVTDTNCIEGDPSLPLNASDYALAPESPPETTCGSSSQACCTDTAGVPLSTGACSASFACNSNVCGPAVCIPNTNFATGDGATQGHELFVGIQTAGPAAYQVTYSP